jgi:hypothetical protein
MDTPDEEHMTREPRIVFVLICANTLRVVRFLRIHRFPECVTYIVPIPRSRPILPRPPFSPMKSWAYISTTPSWQPRLLLVAVLVAVVCDTSDER